MHELPQLIVEAAASHAQHAPGRRCIGWHDGEITYGRLWDRTQQLARGLRAAGLGAGERVALVMDNAPNYVAAYLAIQLAGGVAVLVNPLYRAAAQRAGQGGKTRVA